jgi:sporulation protein YlmC with PRC-barrel domain
MEENMIKYLAAALLTTALLTGAASAQTSTATKAATAGTAGTMHKKGDWRASKLVGVNVYNDANEKIGDINDVILDKSGKVENVILGVGGFLGMGEHYVAVSYDSLKWSNEPPRSTTASTTTSPNTRPATNVDSDKRTASDGTTRTTGAAMLT